MKQQQGATMIVVLVVLLLVAIAGTIALRSGVFGMRLSTNSQVTKLLDNNNDTALVRFEDMDAGDIAANFALGGFYNHLLDPATADDELVFCYNNNTAELYQFNRVGIIKENDTVERTGFCDATTFSSGRNAVITQIHLRKNTADDRAAEGYTVSVSVPTVENRIKVSLSAISVIPTFSNNSDANEINACLQRTAFKKTPTTQTNAECFVDLGIPHSVHNVDFESGNAVAVGS